MKKPVCKRGSILLGELVAVQIALEYFLQHLDSISCRFLEIFSESQSTVGILTLNLKETGYKDITTEIRQTITTLQQKGAEVDISWTPKKLLRRQLTNQRAEIQPQHWRLRRPPRKPKY